MLGLVMINRLIRSGQSNHPSSPSKGKADALQFAWDSSAMDYSSIRIPSSDIQVATCSKEATP